MPPVQVQRDRWWLVAAAGLAGFMVMLDASIVNVALPTIETDFGVRTSATEWVTLGYLLSLSALVVPSGRWLDRAGRRAALLLGVGGFGLTSALAAAAPAIGWLVAARIAQGAFGAVLFALVPALATTAVRPEARARALGVVGALGPLGAVSGPALGGLLVGAFGWPSIFLVNVPVSAALIVMALATMPAGPRLQVPDAAWLAEAGLLGGAVLAVLLPLSLAPAGGAGWLALLVVAAVLLVIWRRLPTSDHLAGLVRAPGVGGPLTAMLLLATAGGLVQFLSPFFLERVLHTPPTEVGLTVAAFPLAMSLTGPLGGALADRFGTRPTAVAGGVVLAAGLALCVPLPAGWRPADLAWRLAVIGIGMGLFVGPNQAAIMTAAPRRLLASAGGASGLSRSLGFSLGPALATAAWSLAGYRVAGMRAGVAVGVVAAVLAICATGLRRGAPRAAHGAAPADADRRERVTQR